jgi:hypothetical protein
MYATVHTPCIPRYADYHISVLSPHILRALFTIMLLSQITLLSLASLVLGFALEPMGDVPPKRRVSDGRLPRDSTS